MGAQTLLLGGFPDDAEVRVSGFALFISALFTHVFAVIGGVLTVIGVVEKAFDWSWKIKPKWFAIGGLCLLFLGTFQAWNDEHNNSTVLIQEKRDRDVKIGALEALEGEKDKQIVWWQQHQSIQVSAPATDPALIKAVELNSQALHSMSNREQNRAQSLKKDTIQLANTMLKFLSDEEGKRTYRRTPNADPATEYIKIDQEIMARYTQEFAPASLALLQGLRDEGEDITGIKTSELTNLARHCTGAVNSLVVQDCALELGALGRKMR